MSIIKAIFILLMIGINWLAFILLLLPLHAVAFVGNYVTRVRWSLSIFLAEDHLVNVIMGGHFRTTISAEIGNMQNNRSATSEYVAKVVNGLFYLATKDETEKDHCRKSIEKEDVFIFSSIRAIIGTLIFQTVFVLISNAVMQTYL